VSSQHWRMCMPRVLLLFFFSFVFQTFVITWSLCMRSRWQSLKPLHYSLIWSISCLQGITHFHLESSNPGLLWPPSVTSNWFQISSQATFYTLLQELYLSMSQEAFPFALSPLVPFWLPLLYYVCKGPWYTTPY